MGVIVNEVLANTDPPSALSDAIELRNASETPVDISGWFLSDSADDLLKHEIPAGSVLAMNRGIANLVKLVGFSLEEAVQTATLNPAWVLGLDGRLGALRPGMAADLVLLEPDTLAVLATWVRGELVYSQR